MFTTDASDGNNIGWSAIKRALTDWQKIIILLGQICIVMPVVGCEHSTATTRGKH